MKSIDIIRRSGRSIGQAKLRTLLTAAALAVGGFTLTLTLAAATGARGYTERLVRSNIDPASLIVVKDKKLLSGSAQTSTQPQEYDDSLGNGRGVLMKELDLNDIHKLRAIKGVQSIFIDYQVNAQFVSRPLVGAKRYTATLENYNNSQKPALSSGSADDTLKPGTVLLPYAYIDLLGFKSAQDALGQPITAQVRQITGQTSSRTLIIAGVTSKVSSSLNLKGNNNNILLSQSDVTDLYSFSVGGTVNADKFVSATVHVANGDNKAALQATQRAIEQAGYGAESSQDAEQFLGQIVTILQGIVLGFGVITLIASFFGVVNTQYISVLERTREIGLMKALGMSRGTVSRLFILEATWIGFIGALFGSLLAFAVGSALNPWISRKLNFGKYHLLVFDIKQVVLLIIFLMAVTTLAGLLPARKAARLSPIDALRTE